MVVRPVLLRPSSSQIKRSDPRQPASKCPSVFETVLETYNLFARFRLHKYSLNCTQTELGLFLVVCFDLISTCDLGTFYRHIGRFSAYVETFLKKVGGRAK